MVNFLLSKKIEYKILVTTCTLTKDKMDENPLRTNVLTPERLTMRIAACFYCGNEDYNDFGPEYLFGIRHCPTHKEWAMRDCRAECQRIGRIPLTWLKKDERFTALLDVLKNDTNIKRTSGAIEQWILGPADYMVQNYVCKFYSGWGIPMCSRDLMSSRCFLVEELKELNPQIDPALFDRAVEVLEGIYKADLEAHEEAKKSGESTALPEDPRIRTMRMGNRDVRVFG